jgi:hypothetical protein
LEVLVDPLRQVAAEEAEHDDAEPGHGQGRERQDPDQDPSAKGHLTPR